MFLDATRIGYTLSISHKFEQFGLNSYVCTKEIYRPQRDSNPVPPVSQSTTLPMSYREAMYLEPTLGFILVCSDVIIRGIVELI